MRSEKARVIKAGIRSRQNFMGSSLKLCNDDIRSKTGILLQNVDGAPPFPHSRQ